MAKSRKPKHIAIAGNIGAGKTTLTELLSKHYKWIPHFEDVDHNPYLMDFYEDMPRWSFNLQIFFLNSRLKQLVEIQKGTETIIQDRTIYEDANIFAPNLHGYIWQIIFISTATRTTGRQACFRPAIIVLLMK